VLRGQPHRGVLRSVTPVTAVPLDEFEEDTADRLRVAVAELALRVVVVEDAEFPVRRQVAIGELIAGGQVVVVVVAGIGSSRPPASQKRRAAATTSSVARAMRWARAPSPVGAGPTPKAIRTLPSALVTARLRCSPYGSATSTPISTGSYPLVLLFGILAFGVVYSAANGVWPSFYGEMFSTRVRLSGMAIGTQIGFAVAGFAVTFAAQIAGPGGNDWSSVALFTAALCIPPALAALTARETHKVPTEDLGERVPQDAARREAVTA
jgi:hypothetical protein